MLNTPFSPWPSYTQEEADAVCRVLLSNRVNYWTGNECREFEAEFAEWSGCKYAVAVMNGTFALEAALKALGIGPGADVIVTSRSFVASASCAMAAGARPVFAEVDLQSQNITSETIQQVLTPATRAIVCVHLGGMPCDMDPIMNLAQEFNLKVVEDCAQAHGASYRGKPVGSMGHVGAWSFCQDKIMSTGGEGGMVTTNDEELWSRVWSYKDHGKSWEAVNSAKRDAGFKWIHDAYGTNGRMLEMQAAIGRWQLRRMATWNAQRSENANRIADVCRRFSVVRVPEVDYDIVHAWYRFYLFVRPDRLANGWTRDRILDEINARGVPCYQGSCAEIYLERAFLESEVGPSRRHPIARSLGETSLAFLVHPSLTEKDLDRTCSVLEAVLSLASCD